MVPSEEPAASSGAKGRFPEFPELDGFRGLALLLVLVEHALRWSLRIPGPWDHWGSAGVILFFGLSGFLITGLLCAEPSGLATWTYGLFGPGAAFGSSRAGADAL